MKIEDLSISRQGKHVVIDHEKYKIEYNLTKGTWNYCNNNGKTVIKNGFAHISLADGTSLNTQNPGFREFRTLPVNSDAHGSYQTLHFIYENTHSNGHSQKSTENDSNEKTDKLDNPSKNRSSDDSSSNETVESDQDRNKSGIRIHTYLTCYSEQPYVLLKVEVENLNTTSISLSNITLIDITSHNGSVQLDSHPSQYNLFLKTPPISPSDTSRQKIYDGYHFNKDKTLQPCQNGILHDTLSKNSFVFGFITTSKWWPRMQIGYEVENKKSQQGMTAWTLYNDCENTECQSGDFISSEIGYLDFSEDGRSSYKRYVDRLASESNALVNNNGIFKNKLQNNSNQNTGFGWNFSAENLDDKVSAKSIKEQINSITDNSLFEPSQFGGIDFIHIESGWQPNPGSMNLHRDSFPEGMAPVVELIHSNELMASICIDPFAIECNSDFIKKNPDSCLRYKSSEKSGSEEKKHVNANAPVEIHLPGRDKALTILDISDTKTQTHVKNLIKKIVDDWGYDIIKVDLSSYTSGMMTVASNTTWKDKTLSSAELYQYALRFLNDAVKSCKRKVILSGYNVIDSVSIGNLPLNYPLLRRKNVDHSDTWHQQNGTKHRLCRYATTLQEHNILWNHVFGDLAIDEPRPVNEAIVEITAAALSGASVFCANTPNQLTTGRAELVAKIFPLNGQAAKLVDLYDETLPRIWHLPIETENESWDLIGLFNWKDVQDDVQLNLDIVGLHPDKDYLVHDFWMRDYLGVVSKNVTLLNMAPRSAKLLCLKAQQPIPQLLSTDLHYTQGSIEILSTGWDEHSQSYLVICQPPRQVEGTLFIHVPDNYIPIGVSAYGSAYKYSWNKPIYQLTFDATDSLINTSIQFMKTEGSSKS